MAKYQTLVAAIEAAIKTNGTQAITGQVLQTQLKNMVSKLGAAYQFGGVVQPTDSFPSDYADAKVAFLACNAGQYPNFGGFSLLSGEVALFIYEGTWKKQIVSYYANTQIYGIRHFYNNGSPELTRIGDADLHRDLPVQSLMRRCVVDDTGAVKYYLGANDSTKKEDGATAAVLSGADGQVMVEIPAHYRKCTTDATNGYMDVEISLYPFEGAIAVPRYLVSAYEATMDRENNKLASVVNTTAAFRGGNNNADWDGTYRSLLGKPATNISLTNFRTYGRNRGTGWGCYDYNAHLAIYWLFCIEYATTRAVLVQVLPTLIARSGVTLIPTIRSSLAVSPIPWVTTPELWRSPSTKPSRKPTAASLLLPFLPIAALKTPSVIFGSGRMASWAWA